MFSSKAWRYYNAAEITYFTTWSLAGFFAFTSLSLHFSQGTLRHYLDGIFTPKFLISILFLSVCATVIALLLLNKVMKELPLMVVSSFNALTTVTAVFCGFFFLGETFTLQMFIGMAFIILSVSALTRSSVHAK